MNSSSTEDRPSVRAMPPVVFLAFLAVAGALEYWCALDHPRGPFGLRGAIALAIFIASGSIAAYAIVAFARAGIYVNPRKPAKQIVEDGPFRFTRNPMYLGLVLVLLSLGVLLLSAWFFLSAIGPWFVLDRFVIVPEEAYLEQKFGDRYLQYRKRARRWI